MNAPRMSPVVEPRPSTPRGRGWLVHGVCLVMVVSSCGRAPVSAVRADDAVALPTAGGERGASPLEFTRIHVPAGRLSDIPLGATRYVPMSAREFEEGIAKLSSGRPGGAGGVVEPAVTLLADSARYQISLADDGNLVGRASFAIGSSGQATAAGRGQQFGIAREMPLGSLEVRSVTISTVAGTGEAVVFGRRDGTLAVAIAEAGTCTCPAGFSACRGECRNLQTDPDNCGACGAVCTDIQACIAGDCTCPDGGELCGGRCTSTGTDAANCGTCGNRCATGGLCNAGSCACPGRQTDCGGDCTDTRIDNANCGTCGRACTGLEECNGGACACPATATQCGADCTDLQTDPNNCGSCGNTCAAGTECVAGICGCPCGGNSCDLGTCFVLPIGSPGVTSINSMLPELGKLDLAVSMDTTGSMATPIAAVQIGRAHV